MYRGLLRNRLRNVRGAHKVEVWKDDNGIEIVVMYLDSISRSLYRRSASLHSFGDGRGFAVYNM